MKHKVKMYSKNIIEESKNKYQNLKSDFYQVYRPQGKYILKYILSDSYRDLCGQRRLVSYSPWGPKVKYN